MPHLQLVITPRIDPGARDKQVQISAPARNSFRCPLRDSDGPHRLLHTLQQKVSAPRAPRLPDQIRLPVLAEALSSGAHILRRTPVTNMRCQRWGHDTLAVCLYSFRLRRYTGLCSGLCLLGLVERAGVGSFRLLLSIASLQFTKLVDSTITHSLQITSFIQPRPVDHGSCRCAHTQLSPSTAAFLCRPYIPASDFRPFAQAKHDLLI